MHSLPCLNNPGKQEQDERTQEVESTSAPDDSRATRLGDPRSPYSRVLQSVFDPATTGLLTQALAEVVLALGFSLEDAERIGELSDKAVEGTLSEDEKAERQAYLSVGEILEFWRVRAQEIRDVNNGSQPR